MSRVGLIDIGIGNIFSLQQAVKHLGSEPVVVSEPLSLDTIDFVILPGVGTYQYAVEKLNEKKLDIWIQDVVGKNIPFLGICLGMQLLFEKSIEGGVETKGLEVFHGEVVKIERPVSSIKLPNMGWRSVKSLENIETKGQLGLEFFNNKEYYFMHSYMVTSDHSFDESYISHYGAVDILACIRHGNTFATQFHPEKSGKNGLALLNYLLNKDWSESQ
ncbi:MAG: imidazole glycerol phosphate synthase subunit HisH [Gammaproteobacteria bacterium]|nr:imidazole glycerol phosphate synthase subunit HisH [Gammaproteobacteria bacterium]MCH9743465.1 imidazole glycerol phosphate synthase subunit HisH [Gammaproteobacteria bacterium]